MSCNCGSSYGNSCPNCYPSSRLYNCPCEVPDLVESGSHLGILDGQFCPYRLENQAGLLVNRENGSGGFEITFSTAPVADLDVFTWTAQQEFGNLVAINADGAMRQLQGPATPNLFPRTNANGDLIFDTLPAATIPDPLTISTLNATTVNAGALNATGAVALSGLATGTIANTVGLDGSGNLVKGGSSTGLQSSMFYEAPTSPSAATPNASALAGDNMIIGNQLYDSGGSIVGVVDGQTLKVLVAGKYRVDWGGFISFRGKKLGAALNLVINGITVNSGNCPSNIVGTETEVRTFNVAGFEFRDLAVNDLIRIQLVGGNYADTNSGVYSVRMGFTKFS
jgi:hypothetical protein